MVERLDRMQIKMDSENVAKNIYQFIRLRLILDKILYLYNFSKLLFLGKVDRAIEQNTN